MNKFIKIMIVLMFAFFVIHPVISEAKIGRGGKPGALLTFGAGARPFGMGKAFVSIADDASAAIWNPAGLALIDKKEVTALHTILYYDTNLDFLSYANPTRDMGTFALSILYLSSVGFEGRDEYNVVTGSFTASQMAAGGSYGTQLLDKIFAGANIKYFSNTLETSTSGNVLLDLGILAKPLDTNNFSLGLSFNNLLNFKIGDLTEDAIPIVTRFGASYLFLNDQLLLSGDYDASLQGWFFGTEYKVFNPRETRSFQIAVRLGINFEEITGGFGAWYQQDYGFDYAFSTQELGGSHRFSATVKFGDSMILARENRDKAVLLAKKAESKGYYEAGLLKYEQGYYIDSIADFKEAVKNDPENYDAKRILEKMELVTEFVPKQIDDSEISTLIRKAIKCYIEDDTKVAYNALQQAIYKDPANKRIFDLAKAIEKKEGIVFEYKPYVELDKIKQLLNDAEANFWLKKYDKMVESCRQVLQLDENNFDATSKLGSAYYALGDRAKAVELWEKALRLKPNNKELPPFIKKVRQEMQGR